MSITYQVRTILREKDVLVRGLAHPMVTGADTNDFFKKLSCQQEEANKKKVRRPHEHVRMVWPCNREDEGMTVVPALSICFKSAVYVPVVWDRSRSWCKDLAAFLPPVCVCLCGWQTWKGLGIVGGPASSATYALGAALRRAGTTGLTSAKSFANRLSVSKLRRGRRRSGSFQEFYYPSRGGSSARGSYSISVYTNAHIMAR